MPQPFKHPTTYVYYYRRKVPKALQAALGREYKRSLGAQDLDEAKSLFRAEGVRCERASTLARAQAGAGSSPITPDDAPAACLPLVLRRVNTPGQAAAVHGMAGRG